MPFSALRLIAVETDVVKQRRSKNPNTENISECLKFKTKNVSVSVRSSRTKSKIQRYCYSLVGEYENGEMFDIPINAAIAQILKHILPFQG